MSKTNSYIVFKLITQKLKTKVWEVIAKSSKTKMGVIKWSSYYRKYCFFPEANIVFGEKYLLGIGTFVGNLNKMRIKNKSRLYSTGGWRST